MAIVATAVLICCGWAVGRLGECQEGSGMSFGGDIYVQRLWSLLERSGVARQSAGLHTQLLNGVGSDQKAVETGVRQP